MSMNILLRWVRVAPVLVLSIFLFGFEQKGIGTEQGLYSVDVQFTGSSVRVGKNSLEVTIHDRKSRKPVEQKLAIEVIPWMPAHEHGSSDKAKVSYLGHGRYLVESLTFTMPGDWEVYLRITDNGREDTAVFNVLAGR